MLARNQRITQKNTPLRSSKLLRLAGAALLVVLAPTMLLAHARLVRSQPSAGEHLTASPASIRLVFSEAPMVPVSRVFLLDSRGDTIRLGSIRADSADAHTMLADIATPLDSGSYTVHWSTAASDGHASHGSFTFVVTQALPQPSAAAATAAAAPPAAAPPAARANGKMEMDEATFSYPMTIARWLGFLALFSLVGAVSFRYLVLQKVSRLGQPDDPFDLVASTGAATFGLFAAVVLVIASLAKLYGMTVSMSNVSGTTIMFDTGWGWAVLAQLAAALIAIVAFRIAHSNKDSGWSIAAVCAIIVCVTPALTGHAIGSDQALVNVPLDVLHVLSGSIWLGTLAVIVIVGVGAAFKTPGTTSVGTRVAAMINAFSPIALTCGATIVTSGVIVALLRLRPLSTLWTSGYGKVLIVKIGFVGLLLTLGAWNWRRVKPRLTFDEGLPALRQSARMELIAGAIVLAVTAFLVAMALPD